MNRLHVWSLLAVLTGALVAQDDPKPPDKQDKEVAEKLKQLKDVVDDRKCEHDAEGIVIVTDLVKKWRDGMHDKDKKDVVRGLAYVMGKGKLRDEKQQNIYIATATALGELGVDGAKPLLDAFKDDRFPNKDEWVPLRETILRALGKTKDESMVKFLIDTAKRQPSAALQAAAGEALGNFSESKDALRKEIVVNLLRYWGEMDSRSRVLDTADLEAQNMRNRLTVVSGKWNATMRLLTKQNLDNYPDWNTWYNKNKTKEWK